MKKFIPGISYLCALIQTTVAISPKECLAEEFDSQKIQIDYSKEWIPPKDSTKTFPEITYSTKNAPLAGALNLILPGTGHAYIGDYSTASKYFGVDFCYYIDSSLGYSYSTPVIFSNFSMYSAYAGYRDARALHAKSDYRYQMPKESLLDLIKAPFEFSILKKPEVFGGLIASLLGAVILGKSFQNSNSAHLSLSAYAPYSPLIAFPVGIGEEALFRGYIQSGFMEMMPAPHAIAFSSAIFGLAHVSNANGMPKNTKKQYYYKSIPWITFLGGYMGYLTHKNHSLKESTALHAWYDFVIFLGAYAATKDEYGNINAAKANPNQEISYSMSFDF